MGSVIRLDRVAVLRVLQRRIRRIFEAGRVTWAPSVLVAMRQRGSELDPQDLEHLIETATVIDYDVHETKVPGVRHFTIAGVTIEGKPARLLMEERSEQGRRFGVIVRFEWLSPEA